MEAAVHILKPHHTALSFPYHNIRLCSGKERERKGGVWEEGAEEGEGERKEGKEREERKEREGGRKEREGKESKKRLEKIGKEGK